MIQHHIAIGLVAIPEHQRNAWGMLEFDGPIDDCLAGGHGDYRSASGFAEIIVGSHTVSPPTYLTIWLIGFGCSQRTTYSPSRFELFQFQSQGVYFLNQFLVQ